MRGKIRSELLNDFHGVLLIDKESGITSYDILRKIKKVFF
jgi:tRNA U55 pseudouridine synthase TruB